MNYFQNFDIEKKVLHDSDYIFNYTRRVCNELQSPGNLVRPLQSLCFVMILSTYSWKVTGRLCRQHMIYSICRRHRRHTNTFGVLSYSSLDTRELSPRVWGRLGSIRSQVTSYSELRRFVRGVLGNDVNKET